MDADSVGKQLLTSWARIARGTIHSGTAGACLPVIPVYVEIGNDLFQVSDVVTSDKIILKIKQKHYQD